jgi:hypothetical protein
MENAQRSMAPILGVAGPNRSANVSRRDDPIAFRQFKSPIESAPQPRLQGISGG